MARLINADALKDEIREYANEPSKIRDRRWDTRCTAIIADMIGLIDKMPTIKADAPRVMTPEEVMSTGPEDVFGIVEIMGEKHMYGCYMRRYDEGHVELCCDVPNLPKKLQKGCARIWTDRPTDEEREAAAWNN